mgnify:CR=1 FL=1
MVVTVIIVVVVVGVTFGVAVGVVVDVVVVSWLIFNVKIFLSDLILFATNHRKLCV